MAEIFYLGQLFFWLETWKSYQNPRWDLTSVSPCYYKAKLDRALDISYHSFIFKLNGVATKTLKERFSSLTLPGRAFSLVGQA